MIAAAVADDVDEAGVGDVVDEPAYFIGMPFNNDAEVFSRVDYPVGGTVIVQADLVNERTDILNPKLLSRAFEASGRSIVEIGVEKFFRLFVKDVHVLKSVKKRVLGGVIASRYHVRFLGANAGAEEELFEGQILSPCFKSLRPGAGVFPPDFERFGIFAGNGSGSGGLFK